MRRDFQIERQEVPRSDKEDEQSTDKQLSQMHSEEVASVSKVSVGASSQIVQCSFHPASRSVRHIFSSYRQYVQSYSAALQ